MGEKHVITIRMSQDGIEAELYEKIQQKKKEAGLSTPEYVKGILKRYFDEQELQENGHKVLQEIRTENQRLVEMISDCIHQAGTMQTGQINDEKTGSILPEKDVAIPDEAFEFLNTLGL